jgi:hypothetical protein
MAWFLLAVLWCLKNEQFSLRESLIAGFAYGFVLAIRPGGFFVGALLFLPLFKRLCLGKYPLKTCLRILIRGFGFILLAVLVAWAVMISPWPSAHRDPLFHPIESMRLASSFNESYPVLFLGKMHQSASLPWYYFFLFLGVTTPLAILLLATLGQIRLCADLRFDSKTWSSIGILFLIWFPLTTFVVLRMNVYDGLRHFLFLLPLLAICCGVGSSWLYEKLPIQSQWKRATLITALLLISVPSLVVLHPYQYTYYNVLAGPRITLHERFETDYWVTSYREAAKWINSQNLSAPRVVLAANSFSEPAFLHFASEQTQFVSLLGNYTSASLPRETDFYVGTVRYRQDQNFPSAPIHKRIERNGVLMSVIRKPRSGPLDSNEMR